MSRCPAHGGEFRKGVLVTLLVPGKGLRGARVCQDCANGGMLVVAPKLAPVIEQKIARPEGYDRVLRQLRTLAAASRSTLGAYFEGRADAFEGAIEVVEGDGTVSNDLHPEDLSRRALLRVVERVRNMLWPNGDSGHEWSPQTLDDIAKVFESHSIGRPDEPVEP